MATFAIAGDFNKCPLVGMPFSFSFFILSAVSFYLPIYLFNSVGFVTRHPRKQSPKSQFVPVPSVVCISNLLALLLLLSNRAINQLDPLFPRLAGQKKISIRNGRSPSCDWVGISWVGWLGLYLVIPVLYRAGGSGSPSYYSDW